jgi:nuclear pore complex protein Nup53
MGRKSLVSSPSSSGILTRSNITKDSNQDLALSRAPDFLASISPPRSQIQIQTSQFQPQTDTNAMVVDNAATVGTPIKLAPSVAAFRKAPAPAPQRSAPALVPIPVMNAQHSPVKRVLGQVGDMLFGW